MRDAGKRTRWGLSLCLLALSWCVGCVTVVPAGSPPPCPEWSDRALDQLDVMQSKGEYGWVTMEISRQYVHCMEIDAMREPRVEWGVP